MMDEGQQDSLSEILHNLGAAINYRTDPGCARPRCCNRNG